MGCWKKAVLITKLWLAGRRCCWQMGTLIYCGLIVLTVWLSDSWVVWLAKCLTCGLSELQVVWFDQVSECLILLNAWISDFTDCLNVWLPECLNVWLSDFTDCLIAWLSECLIVWMSDLTDWLTDWISECLNVWFCLMACHQAIRPSAIRQSAQLLFRYSTTLVPIHSVLHPTSYPMYSILALSEL